MAKLPTKAIGATANYNGANLVCKQDGEYQGVPKLKWFHVGACQKKKLQELPVCLSVCL